MLTTIDLPSADQVGDFGCLDVSCNLPLAFAVDTDDPNTVEDAAGAVPAREGHRAPIRREGGVDARGQIAQVAPVRVRGIDRPTAGGLEHDRAHRSASRFRRRGRRGHDRHRRQVAGYLYERRRAGHPARAAVGRTHLIPVTGGVAPDDGRLRALRQLADDGVIRPRPLPQIRASRTFTVSCGPSAAAAGAARTGKSMSRATATNINAVRRRVFIVFFLDENDRFSLS